MQEPALLDLQMPERCRQFCEMMAYKFSAGSPLRKCLVAHLTMLWDLALISPADVDGCMILLANPSPHQKEEAAAGKGEVIVLSD